MARDDARLFLLSLLILFLELVLIRWLPAHVLYLTFFTNVVLLGSFLGLAVGCLSASSKVDLFRWTPAAVAATLGAAVLAETFGAQLGGVLDVGQSGSPDMVFFGVQEATFLQRPPVPMEALAGAFFGLTALVFACLGQALGRAFRAAGNGLRAYGWNVAGSLAGTLLFGVVSLAELSPPWWIAGAALAAEALLPRKPARAAVLRAGCWLAALVLAMRTTGYYPVPVQTEDGRPFVIEGSHLWSPYYRIDYAGAPWRDIKVNLIGHQRMISREDPLTFYALPHLLRADAGGRPFEDVLVIGAGSGNDVSRALQWGAKRVDAVEIDPALQRLGAKDHPDHPYDDARVTVHIDDGRSFLRRTDKTYDLVVYALVDSLVLHSGVSNLRLESYLFTREALRDVRRRLKPGGVFAMYNYFRQGWLVGRLDRQLEEAFGERPLPLIGIGPTEIRPDQRVGFALLLAGDVAPIGDAMRRRGEYFAASRAAPGPGRPNGFKTRPPADGSGGRIVRLADVERASDDRGASDDWPFLYVRRPMLPAVTLRGMAVMALFSLAALLPWLGGGRERGGQPLRMFFLGAGFMLLETKAVVQMALLFGGTWIVNTLVFSAVLLAILAGTAFVARRRPRSLAPWYAALLAALAAWTFAPMEALLALPRVWAVTCAGALAFAPVACAAVVFAACFSESRAPDRDFGWNAAGAMAGGLAENASMLVGFKGLGLLAAAFYLVSAASPRAKGAS